MNGLSNPQTIEREKDFDFEQFSIRRLANFVLTLAPLEAMQCCQPFLDAVSEHPKEVATFVEILVMEEERRVPNETCFWNIWQALADKIIDAPWTCEISSRHSFGVELVDRMLLKMYWRDGLRSWPHLDGHEQQVNAFTTHLPATSPVLLSFVYYLYKVGERALPEAFATVADRLQMGNPTQLLSDGNIVFYLDSLLQQYVYGQPLRLKSDPDLRVAILHILDHLVDAGSSAAYKMRDDFVTPSHRLYTPQS